MAKIRRVSLHLCECEHSSGEKSEMENARGAIMREKFEFFFLHFLKGKKITRA